MVATLLPRDTCPRTPRPRPVQLLEPGYAYDLDPEARISAAPRRESVSSRNGWSQAPRFGLDDDWEGYGG